MKKIILIYFIFMGSSSLYASDVIDLGKLQVEGDVRKPNIDFIRSGQVPIKVLKKIADDEFLKFEKELLNNETKLRAAKSD